jgi:hypothetical protein
MLPLFRALPAGQSGVAFHDYHPTQQVTQRPVLLTEKVDTSIRNAAACQLCNRHKIAACFPFRA